MGLFGGAAAATALAPGKAAAGNVSELTVEEQTVLDELARSRYIAIPSRKSLMMTPELWEKRRILKRLVYKNRICIDFSIADRNSETSETCLVFYMPGRGTPLDTEVPPLQGF